jgi:hypothetical protein
MWCLPARPKRGAGRAWTLATTPLTTRCVAWRSRATVACWGGNPGCLAAGVRVCFAVAAALARPCAAGGGGAGGAGGGGGGGGVGFFLGFGAGGGAPSPPPPPPPPPHTCCWLRLRVVHTPERHAHQRLRRARTHTSHTTPVVTPRSKTLRAGAAWWTSCSRAGAARAARRTPS